MSSTITIIALCSVMLLALVVFAVCCKCIHDKLASFQISNEFSSKQHYFSDITINKQHNTACMKSGRLPIPSHHMGKLRFRLYGLDLPLNTVYTFYVRILFGWVSKPVIGLNSFSAQQMFSQL